MQIKNEKEGLLWHGGVYIPLKGLQGMIYQPYHQSYGHNSLNYTFNRTFCVGKYFKYLFWDLQQQQMCS